jgi:osmotically-inducible protein OsmY
MKQRAHRGSHEGHDGSGRVGYEGWRRGRESGGFGSSFAAWSSGIGHDPNRSGFGSHRAGEDAGRGDGWAAERSDRDHRGRGPRGYQRSDDRIREEVCEQLTDDGEVDATEISVQVQDGEVTLTGVVSDRHQKRRAAECAGAVRGVHDVFNQLRVTTSDAVLGTGGADRR